MDAVRIRIKSRVHTATHGAMQPGDIVSTDAETARHLVDDCNAAEYMTDEGTGGAAHAKRGGRKQTGETDNG